MNHPLLAVHLAHLPLAVLKLPARHAHFIVHANRNRVRAVLRLEFARERRGHELPALARRRGEVRLARFTAGRGDRGRVLHRARRQEAVADPRAGLSVDAPAGAGASVSIAVRMSESAHFAYFVCMEDHSRDFYFSRVGFLKGPESSRAPPLSSSGRSNRVRPVGSYDDKDGDGRRRRAR